MTKEKREEIASTSEVNFIKGLIYILITGILSVGAYLVINYKSMDKFQIAISCGAATLGFIVLMFLMCAYSKKLKNLRS